MKLLESAALVGRQQWKESASKNDSRRNLVLARVQSCHKNDEVARACHFSDAAFDCRCWDFACEHCCSQHKVVHVIVMEVALSAKKCCLLQKIVHVLASMLVCALQKDQHYQKRNIVLVCVQGCALEARSKSVPASKESPTPVCFAPTLLLPLGPQEKVVCRRTYPSQSHSGAASLPARTQSQPT